MIDGFVTRRYANPIDNPYGTALAEERVVAVLRALEAVEALR